MEIFNIVILSLSALLLFYAGINRVIKPVSSLCMKEYQENPELKLAAQTDIYNEMRGGGSLTAFGAIVIALGIFVPQLRLASLVVATTIFIGFALGRLVSLNKDGKPNKDLMQGLVSEIILGIANALCVAVSL